ncbi:MAG: GTP cyclohydrolase [Weeksellaceae bacterium]|jgi:GNAT superfamily N-acetyltransferase|nr:GTP cyclohydrolase [Weeksellaceae bacterium]
MNNIIIKEADSHKLLKKYVKFPFSLYKGHPYWIPPLISDELSIFNKKINPAFDNAEAHFYLALKKGKIVGRIAAIINWDEVNKAGKKKIRFGWWDVVDDIEVTKVLIEKVFELGRKHQLEYAEGPMGFSNLNKVGVLTEGFDRMGNTATWYNYPYYKVHLEQLGFVKEKEFHESRFSFDGVNPESFMRIQTIIKERHGLRAVNFKKSKEIIPYVDKMFDLFNRTYAKLSSFVPVTERQKKYFKKKYIPFINPEYVKFVEDKNGKLIAFSIVLPEFSEALRKSKGKLFPFGFYYFMHAKKHSKEVSFYLIGVEPEYQNKGVTAIIFSEYYKVFKEKGIESCIRTPELEENYAIHNLWKNFNSVVDRRRRTYKKDL